MESFSEYYFESKKDMKTSTQNKNLFFRTCDGYSCLGMDSCQSFLAPFIIFQPQIEMFPTSHCPGNIEAACNLMKRQMELPCAGTNENSMLVSIVNGDVHLSDPFRSVLN